jgi:hypothetical protein
MRCSVIISFFLLPLVLPLHAEDNGKLKTEIDPGRAGIFVDGQYLGPAANFRMSRMYQLAAGEHEVLLTEPRFKDYTTKVKIDPGKTFVLKYKMEPLPLAKGPFGCLRIKEGQKGKFTAVYLNNKFMGHVDEFNNFAQGLLIPPGDYEAKIVPAEGGAPQVEKVTIKENAVTTIHLK